MPCSRSIPPLLYGEQAKPAYDFTVPSTRKCPRACPAWGWGQSVGVQSSPKNISASRESQLRRSTFHGLRLRGEIRSEGITDGSTCGKTAEATHQPDETVARSTEAHTLHRSEARSRGSVASTVGRVQRFTDAIAQASPSGRLQPSNRHTVKPARNSCIRCKLDAPVTIRPLIPTPAQPVSHI